MSNIVRFVKESYISSSSAITIYCKHDKGWQLLSFICQVLSLACKSYYFTPSSSHRRFIPSLAPHWKCLKFCLPTPIDGSGSMRYTGAEGRT